jgi:hypothetical protein
MRALACTEASHPWLRVMIAAMGAVFAMAVAGSMQCVETSAWASECALAA